MLVPDGVTPPPIISAIEPVTTTAGQVGVERFRMRAPHRRLRFLHGPSCSSARPVTTMGSSCGGSASV